MELCDKCIKAIEQVNPHVWETIPSGWIAKPKAVPQSECEFPKHQELNNLTIELDAFMKRMNFKFAEIEYNLRCLKEDLGIKSS
jgi:hypothetical protein